MEDGISLMLSGGAVGAVCGVLGAWIKARYSKTTVEPNPLDIAKSPSQRMLDDNESAHENLFSRVSLLENRVSRIEGEVLHINTSLSRIESKVDQILIRGNP